jgi:multidrug efflux pump subunit AcrB
VSLPVLASTLTTAVVFFPVTLLAGVSKFLFSAMALAVVVSLFVSYFVAMTVVPLFCSRYLRLEKPEHLSEDHAGEARTSRDRRFGWASRFNTAFNVKFEVMLRAYELWVRWVLVYPAKTLIAFAIAFVCSLGLYAFLGFSFFPRTDAGQFIINLKAASGTKLTVTEAEFAKAETLIRNTVRPADLGMILDNIGLNPGFSSLYSPNSAMHTGFIQVDLNSDHKTGSYEYIARLK